MASEKRRLIPWNISCRIYIGDLGMGAIKQEIADLCCPHGTVSNIWISRRPSGFAFVEFSSEEEAEQASKALNGRWLNGRRVKVRLSSEIKSDKKHDEKYAKKKREQSK